MHNSIDLWTPYGGWIGDRGDAPYGYNVTRAHARPDAAPAGRRARRASSCCAGWTAIGLLGDGRPAGVAVEDAAARAGEIARALVVAADGRDSQRRADGAASAAACKPAQPLLLLGLLARRRARRRPLADVVPRARLRLHVPQRGRPDGGAGRAPPRPPARVPRGPRGRLHAHDRARCPTRPTYAGATRESKLLGKLDLPNVDAARPRVPGLAFVGDAALGGRPVLGHRLRLGVPERRVAGATRRPARWSAAATSTPRSTRYRRVHRRRLGPHHFMISDLACGRRANPVERAHVRRGGGRRPRSTHAFESIGSRRRSPAALFAPGVVARMAARRPRPAPDGPPPRAGAARQERSEPVVR